MAFIEFVLSGFWVWLGFVVIVYVVLDGLAEIIRAMRKPGRKVSLHYFDDLRVRQLDIENATDEDLDRALNNPSSFDDFK